MHERMRSHVSTTLLIALALVGAGCANAGAPAASDTSIDTQQPAPTSTVEQDVVPMQAGAVQPPQGTAYTRKPGESVATFAYRTLQDVPGDWKMAHQAVEVWAAGAPKSIVVTYQEEGMAAQGFHGYVLVSADTGAGVKYTKVNLPDVYHGDAYTQVEAVWSQWNSKNAAPDELFILVSQMAEIGPDAAAPRHETYVFDWTGSGWYVNNVLAKELVDLFPAEKVKEKLNELYK